MGRLSDHPQSDKLVHVMDGTATDVIRVRARFIIDWLFVYCCDFTLIGMLYMYVEYYNTTCLLYYKIKVCVLWELEC